MRRDVACIERDGSAARPQEHVHRDGWHREHFDRVLKAHGVPVGAKKGDITGIARHPKSLEAFQGLLAVVEAWRHAVDAHVRTGDELQGCPRISCLGVGGFNMAVDCKKC